MLESLSVVFPSLPFLVLASPVLANAASLVLCCLVLAKPRLTSLANPHALMSPLFSAAPASLVLASLVLASLVLASLAQAVPAPPFPVSPFPVSLAPVSLGLASLLPTFLRLTCYLPPNSRRLLGAR